MFGTTHLHTQHWLSERKKECVTCAHCWITLEQIPSFKIPCLGSGKSLFGDLPPGTGWGGQILFGTFFTRTRERDLFHKSVSNLMKEAEVLWNWTVFFCFTPGLKKTTVLPCGREQLDKNQVTPVRIIQHTRSSSTSSAFTRWLKLKWVYPLFCFWPQQLPLCSALLIIAASRSYTHTHTHTRGGQRLLLLTSVYDIEPSNSGIRFFNLKSLLPTRTDSSTF